jgi:TP901-1 family phage major tail protein
MAQTTGKMNGTLVKIEVGGTTIAHLTSVSQSFSMATRDASTKDSAGYKEVLEGQMSWSMSGEGFFAEDATYGYEDLYDAINARTLLTVKQTDANAGDVEYSGSAYVTSLERSAGTEDTMTFSISLEGTGATTKAVIV